MKPDHCHRRLRFIPGPVILPIKSGIHRLRVSCRDMCFQADGDLYNYRLS